MFCPICGKELCDEKRIFIWDDLTKRSVRICGGAECLKAFQCDLRKRHKNSVHLNKS